MFIILCFDNSDRILLAFLLKNNTDNEQSERFIKNLNKKITSFVIIIEYLEVFISNYQLNGIYLKLPNIVNTIFIHFTLVEKVLSQLQTITKANTIYATYKF